MQNDKKSGTHRTVCSCRQRYKWRRGGDSNPRHPFGVKLISSQPCSATPAPLRGIIGRKHSAGTALVAQKYSTERPAEPIATGRAGRATDIYVWTCLAKRAYFETSGNGSSRICWDGNLSQYPRRLGGAMYVITGATGHTGGVA